MKKNTYIFLAAAVMMLITACTSIDCDLNGRIQCHYAFQDSTGTGAQLLYPLSVVFMRNDSTDTLFINQQSGVSTLDMPMSNVSDTDFMALRLTLDSVTTITDTLAVCKTNIPTFEDVDCAARYRHDITAVSSTHYFIDTLIVNNSKVSNDASVTNIIIRLRTPNQ